MLDLNARPFVLGLALVGAASGCAQTGSSSAGTSSSSAAVQSQALVAHAVLHNQAGAQVGTAQFRQDNSGAVRITVDLTGMTPGQHGLHIHTTGSCSGDAFAGAGGHFNPANTHHGLSNPAGPHAGDLPNIDVKADGTGHYDGTNTHVTLAPGANSLLDADGSALVVHAGPDDNTSDPAGNSGGRVACGVITSGS